MYYGFRRKAERTTLEYGLDARRIGGTRYENGKVNPDYETIIKLADFYEVSLDELFDRKKYI